MSPERKPPGTNGQAQVGVPKPSRQEELEETADKGLRVSQKAEPKGVGFGKEKKVVAATS